MIEALVWPILGMTIASGWRKLNQMGKCPNVLIWMAVWFAMMCWEVYDLHPDHAVFYSAILFGGAYLEIHQWNTPWSRQR